MDRNYELAELLIETAEELLDESAGRNGLLERIYKQRAKNEAEQNKRNIEKYNNYDDMSIDEYNKLPEKERTSNKYRQKYIQQLEAKDLARYSSAHKKIRKDGTKVVKDPSSNFFGRKYSKDDIIKRLDIKNKTPQNESICDLLIEASMLLNESNDLDNSLKKLQEAKNNFYNNHRSRMEELNNVIKDLNKSLDKKEIDDTTKKLNDINKELDDLLKDL